ncbi:hypothetical protein Pfo_019396 [Paulownia fortunei]|nr:hypothetical protein Pfo_019396 [Paulownia fortunei]
MGRFQVCLEWAEPVRTGLVDIYTHHRIFPQQTQPHRHHRTRLQQTQPDSSNEDFYPKPTEEKTMGFRFKNYSFSLGFLLILSEVCSLSFAEKISIGGSRWSPARKLQFY